MSRPRVVLWSSIAMMFGALPALAQTPPARIGNVYDGTAHQPTAAVQGAEQQAGVAPAPQVQQKENDTVSQIDKELLGKKDNLSNPQAPRQ